VGERLFGPPKDKSHKSKLVPEGTILHDDPSKFTTVPEAPTAQPFDCPNITIEFKLLVLGGDAADAELTNDTEINTPNMRRIEVLVN
jgi:hypothetical protein